MHSVRKKLKIYSRYYVKHNNINDYIKKKFYLWVCCELRYTIALVKNVQVLFVNRVEQDQENSRI